MRVLRHCDGAILVATVSNAYPGAPPVLLIEGEVFGPNAFNGYTLSEATLLERTKLHRGGYELMQGKKPAGSPAA